MTDDVPLLVLCTAPAEGEIAADLARALVQKRLAACVNVLPGLRSFYRWEGKVADDAEVQLFIKTRASRFEALERFLSEAHPYDVPEILALPIERGARSYLDWLVEQTA
jgi:periplasmic divalent cation tolerance protein